MKTLYEKIDKEILSKMGKDREKYPFLVKYIESDLKNNCDIHDLKWMTIKHIYQYKFGDYIPFDVLKFYNLFK
jgi:hypothetical protein